MDKETADVESFTQRINNAVRNVAIAQGLYIGSRLGLFQAMTKLPDVFTPEQLAAAANCKPRLVKEWLLQMVASDVVNKEPGCDLKFSMCEARIEALMCGLCWVNSTMKALVIFSEQADNLVECMKTDGPENIKSNLYKMTNSDKYHVFSVLSPHIIQQVSGLQTILENGGRILDIGCNKGDLLFCWAKLYPNSIFVGVDPWTEVIEKANARATEEALTNVSFYPHDGMDLPSEWTNTFDYVIAVNTLHHISDGVKATEEMKRVLKQNKHLSVVELLRDDDVEENMKQYNSPVFHLFNLMSTASGRYGHGHAHHKHGHDQQDDSHQEDGRMHQGHDLHVETDEGKKHAEENIKEGKNPDPNGKSGKRRFVGGHHHHTYQSLSALMKQGGFAKVDAIPLPKADFLVQIHLLAVNE